MQESDLYDLWESQARTGAYFRCADGRSLAVISRGRRNDGPGPDYLDAVLLVDGVLEVGPVEMHIRESDWFAHHHDRDPAYDRVRLHLLARSEGPLRLPVPTIFARDLLSSVPMALPENVAPATITPALLAELSWNRLLRRVVAIVRAEQGLASPDRLRRAFILRLFDCLGYARNRSAMCLVAESLLADEHALARATLDGVAARVFAAAGLPFEKVAGAAYPWMSRLHLRSVFTADAPRQHPVWCYDIRPANAPERRLWGGVRLLFEIYHEHLLLRLHEAVLDGAFDAAARMLTVRIERSTYIGTGRAREIVINALIPVALAAGTIGGSLRVIEAACLLYRKSPSLESNRVVRDLEDRYLQGSALAGGFWQQGAIEFHQRYRSPDRSALSFIAERG